MSSTRIVDADYDAIRRDLLAMGGMVEEMIEHAGKALISGDPRAAREVIRSDARVDQIEKQIDERCYEVLARQQPMATDLRLLVAVLKITTDLERIGDLATTIARSVRDLAGEEIPRVDTEIEEIFEAVRQMVAAALDAFTRRDTQMAMEVLERDKKIDKRYRRFFSQLVELSGGDTESVEPLFQLLIIARSLERIADHATNIAEDVVYYVRGVDIRHMKGEASDRRVSGT